MFNQDDRRLIRDLARRVAEVAADPVQAARRALWREHNALRPCRPLLLVFPEGSWAELVPADSLRAQDPAAQGIEAELRRRLYQAEHFDCDNVVEAEWIVPKVIGQTGWGVSGRHRPSPEARGAWAFEPVIEQPSDLAKLRFPEVTYDEAAGERNLAAMQDLFGDLLEVKLKGIAHVSYHLMNQWTSLRGLEQVFVDMYAAPGFLHDALGHLAEGHRRLLAQYQQLGLLSLNNDSTYHSSGGVGYSDELPGADYDGRHVRPSDLWASAEAQELAVVSPEQHYEFALQYEIPLLAPFGLNGYGCCEDLSRKLTEVLAIPNLRRVSIAPSADLARSAAGLGRRAILSWKPQPADLVGAFDEDRIRAYLRGALEAARDTVLEIILKDTHTCEQKPERFDRWTRLARQEIERAVEKQS